MLMSMLVSVSRGARAEVDVASCAQWHASGQREAKAGHLKLASELFASCGSNDGCPNAIRADCVDLYAEVERSVPTVIFTASDAQGNDVTNVRVLSADHLLSQRLDGRAQAVDPGRHQFRFVFSSGEAFTTDVLVREGEKNRVVSVRLPAAPGTGAPMADDLHDATPTAGISTSKLGALPPAFFVSAGLGAAALASWGVFALLGHNQQSKLNQCSPSCAPGLHQDFDAMRRDYLVADVSLGIAVASAGVATWFFLTSKPPMPGASQPSGAGSVTRVSVLPSVFPAGAGLVVSSSAF